MDFESCNSAAQFAIQQSQNTFINPNATPFIEFGLNMLATGHIGPTIRIFDVTQPLSFAIFNRVLRWKESREKLSKLLGCRNTSASCVALCERSKVFSNPKKSEGEWNQKSTEGGERWISASIKINCIYAYFLNFNLI